MMTLRPNPKTPRPNPMPDIADYMTPKEAAGKLGFHVLSIYRLVRDGKLESLKVGPAVMISRKSVEKYIQETGGMSKNDPRRKQ